MAHALDGIRIVEVGGGKQLAYCGKLLRDLGADTPLGIPGSVQERADREVAE